MINVTISDIKKVMLRKGHAVFENDTRPFNLNYIGIRDPQNAGAWNDQFIVFWKYKGLWNKIARMGTTDPGIYYLKHPLNPLGTAIHPEGQHRALLRLDKHQGRYTALVQNK